MHTLIANKNKWYRTEDGATDIDFIRSNERVVSMGTRHAPISSATILQKFRERARDLGLKLVNEQAALLKPTIDKETGDAKGGNRFMYLADVDGETGLDKSGKPEYSLSIGFRNFGDKTLSFSGMIGSSVVCCENGLCSSICKPSKFRHTIGNTGNEMLVDGKIDCIFSHFNENKDAVHHQISFMKSHVLTDELLGKFVRQANGKWINGKFVKNPYLGSANLCRILEDLENPERNDKDDNSLFRLLNSCTHITSHVISNPNQSAMASRYCNNLIMSLADADFRPLGDDCDAEEIVEGEIA